MSDTEMEDATILNRLDRLLNSVDRVEARLAIHGQDITALHERINEVAATTTTEIQSLQRDVRKERRQLEGHVREANEFLQHEQGVEEGMRQVQQQQHINEQLQQQLHIHGKQEQQQQEQEQHQQQGQQVHGLLQAQQQRIEEQQRHQQIQQERVLDAINNLNQMNQNPQIQVAQNPALQNPATTNIRTEPIVDERLVVRPEKQAAYNEAIKTIKRYMPLFHTTDPGLVVDRRCAGRFAGTLSGTNERNITWRQITWNDCALIIINSSSLAEEEAARHFDYLTYLPQPGQKVLDYINGYRNSNTKDFFDKVSECIHSEVFPQNGLHNYNVEGEANAMGTTPGHLQYPIESLTEEADGEDITEKHEGYAV
ncbi:uncharacterized protein J8A68_002905 [[Candida] subhashii]|uniref:Uncharacterized protein n=1 Tax=[Candida] subhashii TaxID=561895 RepID=A0A8J5UN48_9ASCO|nr:uncharacterized protein J8A68_002905 [[Candida] subhashii]KAG7663571.1 hypothetical protein J8A68_002905 [[Candida] subhashii]